MTLFPSFSIQGVEGSPDNTTFAFLPKSKKDLLILKLTGQYDSYQGLINPRGCHIIWDVLHKLSRLRPTRIVAYLLLQILVLECEPEGLYVVLLHPLVARDLDRDVHEVVELLVDVVGVSGRHDTATTAARRD